MARENKQREEREGSDLVERLVGINRVSKTVKGGKRFGFAALMVVGDGRGRVGFAFILETARQRHQAKAGVELANDEFDIGGALPVETDADLIDRFLFEHGMAFMLADPDDRRIRPAGGSKSLLKHGVYDLDIVPAHHGFAKLIVRASINRNLLGRGHDLYLSQYAE